MWVLTADSGSLLSVVKFSAQKAPAMAKRHGALDPDQTYLLVRSRIEESLKYMADVLEALYKGEVEGWEKPLIDDDKTADYEWRSVVTADEWAQFLVYETTGISYTSHFKEALRDRAPEGTNRSGIYSAAMSTWSAWSKLQKNPPYGNVWGSYTAKPDCTCGHTELSHSTKGDSCRGKWDQQLKKQVPCDCKKYTAAWPDCTCGHEEKEHTYQKVEQDDKTWTDEHCEHGGCACKKYTPKQVKAYQPTSYTKWCTCGHDNFGHKYVSKDAPRGDCYTKGCTCKQFKEKASAAPALPPGVYVKSAAASAAVFTGLELTDEDLEEIEEIASAHRQFAVDDEFADTYDVETQTWHKQWCPVFDGDSCICTELDTDDELFEGEIRVTEPAVKGEGPGYLLDGVWQESPVPGESAQARKNRNARNKRARRRARKAAATRAKGGE